ncbi:hypothetical protein FNH05_32895 [Amycolatopsis rhizosphaerae]|uniref:Uncharacterized protein n=1 Tax=Amycolatopsis rhizosphaerae TaxID=2053003 RepID=A0A558AHN9_9PSEU|nr:hypothetical protein [Amycolatopsis rhizosphaerae]TVT23749.1 hypothetical protein FNH05_32895 [Amycolatopsis rhizosphaerae]
MNSDPIIAGLPPVQANGLAWVACSVDFLQVRVPHVPVGRSVTGSQVFACVACDPANVRHALGGVLR